MAHSSRPTEERITLDNLTVSARRVGRGDPILLLHGFPHTKHIWREIEPLLVDAGFEVVSPDLRGIGDTDVSVGGFDATDLALDQVRLLDAFGIPAAHVVGFDIGAAAAFAMAAAHRERVASLTVVEAVVGGLRGAESFLAAGAPWWFGFHQVPGGFAEDIVAGAEDRYIRFFLEIGSREGVPTDLSAHCVDAYSGRERLHAAFEHYRAMPANAAWNAAWAERDRLAMPVTAVGASTVKDALAHQLLAVCDDLAEHLLPDAGHIVPIDAPRDLADIVIATAHRSER